MIDITIFKGERPRVASRLLPNESAEYAQDCIFDAGNLEGLYAYTYIQSAPPVNGPGTDLYAIYLYGESDWFQWAAEANVIGSPVAQDPYDRVYFTSNNDSPQVTGSSIATTSAPYPSASYDLGVPAPAAAPTATADLGDDDNDFSTDESRAYIYTYVTGYGEESAPSAASSIIELTAPSVDTVDLTLPTISSNTYNITKKRIYRTATGDNTSYYFVAEIDAQVTTYNDSILAESLGAEIATYDYDPPPTNMVGLCLGSNGIAAGFAGNEFCPSEPYLPYAYPLTNRHTTEHEIVAIAPTTTGFVLGTKGYPYIIMGVTPSSMTAIKIEENQSCVSSKSMVDMGEFVIYASPDGLMSVSEGGASLITRDIITKREWQATFNPSTIRGYRFENKYIGFYSVPNSHGLGFIFEPEHGTITRLSDYATAGFNDLETDTLYLVIDEKLVTWGDKTETREEYTWRSKVFQFPDISFQAVKVWTDDHANVGMKIMVDGTTIMNIAALPAEAFKIPAARGNRWQFELTGTATVERVSFSDSMGAL